MFTIYFVGYAMHLRQKDEYHLFSYPQGVHSLKDSSICKLLLQVLSLRAS